MNPDAHPSAPIDLAAYAENRRLFPEKELAPYAGRYVAFSGDATRIVADAPDLECLFTTLEASGIPLGQVVWEWVPGPDDETWI